MFNNICVLSAVFSFFRLFGLYWVDSLRHSAPSEFLNYLLNQANIIIEIVSLYLCYHEAANMFDFSHTIGLIVDVLQIIAPMITHLVCLIECLYEKRKLMSVWRELVAVLELGGSQMSRVLRIYLATFLGIFSVLMGTCTGIEIFILCRAAPNWYRSRVVAQWSFISCRAALFFYLLHVTLIGCVIRTFAIELKYAADTSRLQIKGKNIENNILATVKMCRISFEKIYRISLDLSDCFGWFLILDLMYNFMAITIALYYNYRRVMLGSLTSCKEFISFFGNNWL